MIRVDNISIMLAAATMIGGAICLGVGGLLVTRGVIKPQIVEGHNEIAGFIFATVGVIYAVLLAFMVFAVWERFADADRAVTEEAAALVAAYRSTQTFPDPLRTQAQQAMRAYATTGVQAEWSNSGTEHFKPHTNPDPLNPIWDVYRELQPTTPSQTMLFTDAIQRLGDLEHQRHLRHLATESSLNEVFWIVLIV